MGMAATGHPEANKQIHTRINLNLSFPPDTTRNSNTECKPEPEQIGWAPPMSIFGF